MRGIMKLKKAALMGMMARNTMVVPCMVNSSLNCRAVTSVLSGCASCSSMMRASMTRTRTASMAVVPETIPLRLWSTVVIQDQMTLPVLTFVPGMNAACVAMRILLFQAQKIGGEGLGLLAAHPQVGHERAGLDVTRILDPLRHVLRRAGHEIGAQGLSAREVRQVRPHDTRLHSADGVAADAS